MRSIEDQFELARVSGEEKLAWEAFKAIVSLGPRSDAGYNPTVSEVHRHLERVRVAREEMEEASRRTASLMSRIVAQELAEKHAEQDRLEHERRMREEPGYGLGVMFDKIRRQVISFVDALSAGMGNSHLSDGHGRD